MSVEIDEHILDSLADRIRDVSPKWRSQIVATPSACVVAGQTLADTKLQRGVALGVELIREGWLLHSGAPRVVEPASTEDAILIGDWCYAAGLCEVAERGDLHAVSTLAGHIGDLSAKPDSDSAAQWDDAIERICAGD